MSAHDPGTRAARHSCPMCHLPITPGTPVLLERGEAVHLECNLGLMDAGTAVAGLLRERPGQPLCATCIAGTLGLTFGEAQAGSARLRAFRGFELRFQVCVGCRRRLQTARSVRCVLA